MPELLIKNSDSDLTKFPLNRLRTTIGRSVRSDLCIPDAFASRLHAEIRKEGDIFWLQDLGSANGTKYNGSVVSMPIPLTGGGEIRIGETTMVFQEDQLISERNATLIADSTMALNPAMTISLKPKEHSTEEILKSDLVTTRSDLLGLISKVGITLLSSTGMDQTLSQIADLVFDAVPAQRCIIMLHDEKSENGLQIAVARERGISEPLEEVRISRTVIDEVITKGNSVLTSDAQHDPRYASQTMSLLGIRSVLAVPLNVANKGILGLVYADSPTFEVVFTEDHLNILTTLASVAAIRVENTKLLEQRFDRERMERELELATEIQQSFQPSAPPVMDGYEFQGISFSCYEIGGDYYDFIPRHDGKLFIALGDVSGKGTAAALLMSSLHAAIHAQVASQASISDTVSSVNKYLANNTPSNRFVTLFIAELDPQTGKIDYINAGHNPPLVAHKDGKVQQLSSGGFPLGILPMAEFEVGSLTLEPSETLVIYSDGVSEANNLAGDEFGLERLEKVVSANFQRPASSLRDKVESALSEFTQTAPANDDITLVIIKKA